MHSAQIELARKQLKFHGRLFHRLYVGKIPNPASAYGSLGVSATYVVEDGLGHRIFSKTVNVVTQEMIRSSNNLIAFPSALQALDEHFNNAYIASDGLHLMQEFCVDAHLYKPDTLKSDPLHGKEVYHADLDEVHLPNDAYINLLGN